MAAGSWHAALSRFFLFRTDVVDQSVDLGVVQRFLECGHNDSPKFDPDRHVLPVRLSMTERQSRVFEEMIQARPKFPGMALIFIDVVADRTVLAKKISPDDKARRFPRGSFDVSGRKTGSKPGYKQPFAIHAASRTSVISFAPARFSKARTSSA